jgi:hypothetical protein
MVDVQRGSFDFGASEDSDTVSITALPAARPTGATMI